MECTEEAYFAVMSKMPPSSQKQMLRSLIFGLEKKLSESSSEGVAAEIGILRELVELPLDEMVNAISSINAKEQPTQDG